MSKKRISAQKINGSWGWIGRFPDHPRKDGRPCEKVLSNFENHPAKLNQKKKYVPESDEVLNQLMDLWFLKRLEIEEDSALEGLSFGRQPLPQKSVFPTCPFVDPNVVGPR